MAEAIYRGYIICKQPYQIFDEVVTFLIDNGCRFTCLSRGSRKITSKNARHLFVGSYVEFQIFQSRHENKLSRLKKVITVKPIDWNYEMLESFNVLNECANKLELKNQRLYKFYQKHLEMIFNQLFYDKILTLIILEQFIKLSGHTLEVNRCIKCNDNKIKTISFKDHGMLCNLCFDPRKDKYFDLTISKAFHYLFNQQYEKLNTNIQELDFMIKLLKIYIDDNIAVKLQSLNTY